MWTFMLENESLGILDGGMERMDHCPMEKKKKNALVPSYEIA